MKKQIKILVYFFGLEYQILKLKELYIKLRYSNDELKEKYIEKKFKEKLNYEINFKIRPITFNQKIQFRKLYENNPLYSICADKYRVREYVKDKIGAEYLIPIYLVTDKLTEEQWNELPNQFVAKANHNSGPVQIVKDKSKVNKRKIIKELNNQLIIDYGILSMEKYYSEIPRKIVVEKYLLDSKRIFLQDLKVHCFNDGKMKKYFFDLCSRESVDGEVSSVLYDENWKNLKITNSILDSNSYAKPKNFDKIKEIARKLSEDFNYVRVDLYNIDEKIYFGELTFCDSSGFGKFTDMTWDYRFGSYWKE